MLFFVKNTRKKTHKIVIIMEKSKTSGRTFVILTLLTAMLFISPALPSRAQGSGDNEVNDVEEVDALVMALGQTFSMFRGFGASGESLAQVFELMFTDFESLNATRKGDSGVFVLNASVQPEMETGQQFFTNNNGTEKWPLWGPYRQLLDQNTNNTALTNNEMVYFKYSHNGSIAYNSTEGVSITLVIWDQDNSFIDALDRLINAVKEFIRISQDESLSGSEAEEQAIEEAVSTITYFLIHINDIITGDEVIVLNLIAYTEYMAEIFGNFETNWYVTENWDMTDTVLLKDVFPMWKENYTAKAQEIDDYWTLWLLNEGWMEDNNKNYTAFSFDVMEIWLKNFHIEIDVAAILEAVTTQDASGLEESRITDIFQGLDIEFYIFTHHFSNWYLYDDAKFDNAIYADDIQAKANNGVPDVVFGVIGTDDDENNVTAIVDSEVTHYMLFRGAGEWIFNGPEYSGVDDNQDFSMTWGVEARDLDFRCIPIGLQDDDVNETVAPIETMEYYKLGFSFAPTLEQSVEAGDWTGEAMGVAEVKLNQEFGEWNGGAGPLTPDVASDSLDLTTVFMSTIFHFHLQVENNVISEEQLDEEDPLLTENNYERESHEVNVGTAATENNGLPLAKIDIAGPDYTQDGVSHPANTNIIPTAFAAWEGQASGTYNQTDGSVAALSGVLNLEFSTLIYAVSYDTFDSTGEEIVHDPTFSVFITTENAGVWGIITLVGIVVLVGVAASLITKKKDKAAGLD